MAQADPKNTDGIAPLQEVVDALKRYIDKNSDVPEKPQRVTATDRQKHLGKLDDVLCTIAKRHKGRKFAKPELQAQVIRNKLLRRIDHHRSSHARWLYYGHFLDENSDLRLCYLIRLTSNQLRIGRRGSRSRTAAREEAAAIKNIGQLDVIERRAFDILKGARRKPRKNLIESRALQLAEAINEKWLLAQQSERGRPKGKWTRKPDAKARSFAALKPQLTLTDVLSIALPIIEEFAGGKITLRNQTFAALLHLARAYSEVITRETPQRGLSISKKAVQQALSRVRRELRNAKTDPIVKLLEW